MNKKKKKKSSWHVLKDGVGLILLMNTNLLSKMVKFELIAGATPLQFGLTKYWAQNIA